MLTGIVEKGLGRGKKDFVPTINLLLNETPEVDYGIYTCELIIGGKPYFGAVHYGPRQTIDGLVTFEVNIFDFDEDIYGAQVQVELLDKIRDIVKFESEGLLRMQIEKDIIQAREMLKLQ